MSFVSKLLQSLTSLSNPFSGFVFGQSPQQQADNQEAPPKGPASAESSEVVAGRKSALKTSEQTTVIKTVRINEHQNTEEFLQEEPKIRPAIGKRNKTNPQYYYPIPVVKREVVEEESQGMVEDVQDVLEIAEGNVPQIVKREVVEERQVMGKVVQYVPEIAEGNVSLGEVTQIMVKGAQTAAKLTGEAAGKAVGSAQTAAGEVLGSVQTAAKWTGEAAEEAGKALMGVGQLISFFNRNSESPQKAAKQAARRAAAQQDAQQAAQRRAEQQAAELADRQQKINDAKREIVEQLNEASELLAVQSHIALNQERRKNNQGYANTGSLDALSFKIDSEQKLQKDENRQVSYIATIDQETGNITNITIRDNDGNDKTYTGPELKEKITEISREISEYDRDFPEIRKDPSFSKLLSKELRVFFLNEDLELKRHQEAERQAAQQDAAKRRAAAQKAASRKAAEKAAAREAAARKAAARKAAAEPGVLGAAAGWTGAENGRYAAAGAIEAAASVPGKPGPGGGRQPSSTVRRSASLQGYDHRGGVGGYRGGGGRGGGFGGYRDGGGRRGDGR